ncbi:hypothetical protein OUZ56_011945 [Daphnia magna]|uniref:DUF4371 domain-containing protein n=1 Tax=Daphnia magna TaxID=35525 RepID=A0ABQ9Z1K4_9CRUS|nr:hypothetical protein OUZ56_011945 [Daphnia magna]
MTSKHERSAHFTSLIEAQRKQNSEGCNNFPQENNVVVLATRLCIFLAENNLPLSLIDQLIPLLRCCFPYDECLRIGAHLENELIQQLKKRFFSIIIDETTDVTTSTQIAVIMIQYWDASKQKLIVDIRDLVQCQDASANGLTRAVVDLLTKSAIPFESRHLQCDVWQKSFSICSIERIDAQPIDSSLFMSLSTFVCFLRL